MLLNKFLSEDTVVNNGLESIPEVEIANEGFRFEDGGIIRANMLAENATAEIDMLCQLKEAESCKLIAEGAINDAYVLQENVITGALNGIKKIVLKLWSRMKEICSSVKLQFDKMFNKSSFLTDAEKAMKNMNDFKDLEFEGYDYTPTALSASIVYNDGEQFVLGLRKEAEGSLNKISAGDSTEATSEKIESVKDTLNKLKGKELEEGLSNKVFKCEPGKIQEELFKKLRNSKDSKDKLTWSKSKCFDAVKNLKSLSNDINSIYESVNTNHKKTLKVIDECISSADKVDRGAKDTEKPLTTAKLNTLKDVSNALKSALALANTVTSAQLQAYKDDAAQARNFIMAAIRQGRKNSKSPKNVNASTDILSFEGIADNY